MKTRVFKQIVTSCKTCPAVIKPDSYCKDYFCPTLREKLYDPNQVHNLCRLPIDDDLKKQEETRG